MVEHIFRAIAIAQWHLEQWSLAEHHGFHEDHRHAAWQRTREAMAEVGRLCREAGGRGNWQAWPDIMANDLLSPLVWPENEIALPTPVYLRTALLALRQRIEIDPPTEQYPPEVAVIRSRGERNYSIGRSPEVIVTVREDIVLLAFLEKPTMDHKQLVEKAGYPDSPRILDSLRTKYNGIFAEAIRLPGGKGKGGYHVSIAPA
jgi:hypothetical protein